MIIAIGNDHSGVAFKKELVAFLKTLNHDVLDLGVDSDKSVDYPLYGFKVGKAVALKKADLGIAICGTGVGISLAANKIDGIRAFVCSEPYTAKLARQHNNANVLCLGARVIGIELAKMIVENFLKSEFESGRHLKRVSMLENCGCYE